MMRKYECLLSICLVVLTAAGCPEPEGPSSNPPPKKDASTPADAGGFDIGAFLDAAGTDTYSDDALVTLDATNPDTAISPDAWSPDSWQPDSAEPPCEDDCTPGSQECDGTDGYRICGQYDLDTCLELSPTIACALSFTCDTGRCVPSCQDECPAFGTLCMDDTTVLSCGNFDTDACLDLGAGVPCGSNQHCESGGCVDDGTACTDECSTGQTICFGDNTRTCGEFDNDSCLDLGDPVPCSSGNTCTSGSCTPFCTHECPSAGASECVGNGTHSCGNFDSDSCLEWGPITNCEPPNYCTNGSCSISCTNECPNQGGAVCNSDNTGVALCGEFDGDPCNDLSTATPCPAGFECQTGFCIASCTNDCTLGTAPRCGADNHSIETCGDFDDDICYEFGGAVQCPGGAACNSGACDVPCTDGCDTADVTECVSGQDATRTCGNWDLDSCLEWTDPATDCESWQVCDTDHCILGTTPAEIAINEIVYDSAGGDTATGNMLMVELWGPAGQSLDGYEIVGVNGYDGSDYGRISLEGEVMGNDGYFLLAHPDGDASLTGVAEITDETINYQNGPDTVQLRWHQRVVDAIGYGAFGSGETFAGEGAPAVSSGGGNSLTRDGNHSDTGDNSVDFSVSTAISPRGNPPLCSDECPTENDTRCSGQQIETCVVNQDADPCLEWSTAVDCPTSGDICDSQTDECVTPSCSDECTPENTTRCNGTQIESCVTDVDSDPCFEWSLPQDCPTAGQECIGGTCGEPCEHECPSSGATRCSGDMVETCGNYDTDACREYSAAVACPQNEICIVDSCQPSSAPEVVLISPQGTIQTTQGNTHRILVDATASPGRNITRVEFFADTSKVGESTAPPHEYYYTVPSGAATNSTIALQAKAVDDQSVVGSSAFAFLDVMNDNPVASFTATITNTTTATVDASASSDTETELSDLEVCWDWDNDGQCDTSYSTEKMTTYDFGSSGTYTIGIVVRDSVGQTDTATREITFTDIQYIGGQTVATTMWYGTVIITGDVIVGSGETLTIADGTQVLFVFADTDLDEIGDYTLDVQGSLVVNGTVDNPVVFSGQDSNAKKPGGWDRIILQGGTNSSVAYAIIEYANVGLEIRNGSTLENVTIRQTSDECIRLNNADSATLTNVSVANCGSNGISAYNGSTNVNATQFSSTHNGVHGLSIWQNSSMTVSGATLESNSGDGARIDSSSVLDISGSDIRTNDGVGLAFYSNSGGNASQNQIRENGDAGLKLWSDDNGSPDPVIRFNNIYSNSTIGTIELNQVDTSSILHAEFGCCNTTGDTSATYESPSGTTIRRVYIRYIEEYTYYKTFGYLENTATGSAIRTFNDDFTGWVYLPEGISQIRVRTRDDGGSHGLDTIDGLIVEYSDPLGAADITAAIDGTTVDVRRNYLGTFPNVLSRVAMNRDDALDLRGFVGVLYGVDWDPGQYKSGNIQTETWSDTIIVTGDIDISAGEIVSVTPGTQIQVVKHDQNADGLGDFSIVANGRFDLSGTTGSEINISGYGAADGVVYQTIDLAGSDNEASSWENIRCAGGFDCLTLRGNSTVDSVDIERCGNDGVRLVGATSASIRGLLVSSCAGDGVVLSNSDNAVLDEITTELNAENGILITNGTTSATIDLLTSKDNAESGVKIDGGSTPEIEDSTIRDNSGHGVEIQNSSPTLNYCRISYNSLAGIHISGSGSASASNNLITFNNDAGVSIWSDSGNNPTPTIQYSNIWGNAVSGTELVQLVDTSSTLYAEFSCCNTVGATSPPYTAPDNTTITRVYINYVEEYTYYKTFGYLENASTGSTIQTFSDDYNGWVDIPSGVSSIRVRTRDDGGSHGLDTITGSLLYYSEQSAEHYEMMAATDSGTTTAKFNYWTDQVGEVPTKVFQSRSNSVDYTGYTGSAYPQSCVLPDPPDCTTAGPRQ